MLAATACSTEALEARALSVLISGGSDDLVTAAEADWTAASWAAPENSASVWAEIVRSTAARGCVVRLTARD